MSERVKLGGYATIQKGKPPLLLGGNNQKAELYLNPEYLRGSSYAEMAYARPDSVRAEEGDALLLWDGSNAGEFFKAKAGLVASTMAKISPDSAFRPDFFFHALKHSESYLKSQTSGTGIPHVDRKLFEDIELFSPNEQEQRSVASILDTLDTAIHATKALIAKLKAVKQGLLNDLLTRGIDANGELRPSQFEAPSFYKASELGDIPNGWRVMQAEQVCLAVIDCKNRTPPLFDSGFAVVRTPNVRDGRFVRAGLSFTDRRSYVAWTQRGAPQSGDVLITREAPVGEVCLLPEDVGQVCLGQRMMLYRPDPKVVNPEFMLFSLLSDVVQKNLHDAAGGSTVGHVRVGDIRRLLIPVPAIDEQVRIAERFKAMEARIHHEEELLLKLVDEKAALMDDLLTGRVRVTPLLDAAIA